MSAAVPCAPGRSLLCAVVSALPNNCPKTAQARVTLTDKKTRLVEASTITVNTKGPPSAAAPPAGANNFPPPKTDKPRPHVCTTCTRAFARLEHLKRHERSHTKEKPFECPECKRCFARRDLLLRHQQKLHQTTTPSARPRNRRESASGVTLGQSRARKNSVAGPNPGASAPVNPAAMRPRANTISSIDPNSLQQYIAAAASPAVSRLPLTHTRHDSLMGFPMQHHFDNQFAGAGMSTSMGHRGMQNPLPRLETHGLPFDSGLRTAPPQQSFFRNSFSMGDMFGNVGTINPSILHCGPHSPQIDPISPSFGIPDLSSPYEGLGFENLMIGNQDFGAPDFFGYGNENAIDGSSPSAISTASPGGMSDAMIDGSNNPASTAPVTTSQWAPTMVSPHATAFPADFNTNHAFPDLMSGNGDPSSPHPLQHGMVNEAFFTPPSSMNSMSPTVMPGLTTSMKPPKRASFSFGPGPETPTSINGSNLGTSPVSTITDSTRHAILGALSSTAALNSTLASRRPSFSLQPSSASSQSPNSTSLPDVANSLPSTQNLQRFVAAYIAHFHPHLPFIHIPTLSFESQTRSARGGPGGVGAPPCLVLSMAAIGALYESEQDQAHQLFELAKKMLHTYLEQRRKPPLRKVNNGLVPDQDFQGHHDDSADTPLWLVQSMLLNVVFGFNCGDQRTGVIASTHCAALVSLAMGAGLYSSPGAEDGDVNMEGDADEQAGWLGWKDTEERKRTLYTIFTLSSLIVSAYNQPPILTNPEILLDLPCDEEFFEAESGAAFVARGGVSGVCKNQVKFNVAFSILMRTNEQRRQSMSTGQPAGLGPNELPLSDLKPSAFGCLILINALHNFIWETRQRNPNKVWTPEQTEKMHRAIEPALRAWRSAWSSNSTHSMRRPNPFNKGPLSADAIPLLDLAYVRLFVNFGRSKELFWRRDWDGIADEFARGSEIVQHAEQAPSNPEPVLYEPMDTSAAVLGFSSSHGGPTPRMVQPATSTPRREKLLRKAAFFAADSLSMANSLDVTFADLTSRDLPLQSAMCAFDCAQVLAEWIATMQDRIGQHLGILGQDEFDPFQVPAIMLLEDEDTHLLQKVQEILDGWETKMMMDFVPGITGGYAVKLLRVTAHMLNKVDVWPGKSRAWVWRVSCLFWTLLTLLSQSLD